jgi:hypothetical protein
MKPFNSDFAQRELAGRTSMAGWARRWFAAAGLGLLAAHSIAQSTTQKTYPSPSSAVAALMEAIKADDVSALNQILGADAQSLISSGDETADAEGRRHFVAEYQAKHSLTHQGADKAVLSYGASSEPFAIPLVRADGAWHFDSSAGAQELIFRRIGQNELDAIKVCKALYAAQKEYARTGHDGNPAGLYASRFISRAGKEDGLYWPVKDGEASSPAGELLAGASDEGYSTEPGAGAALKRAPFHGYFYDILKSQGANAPGGAKDYGKDGKMESGFAFVAYPAEYRSSGVMTFLVSPHGRIYQKDLGAQTTDAAKSLKTFDPDSSWTPVH